MIKILYKMSHILTKPTDGLATIHLKLHWIVKAPLSCDTQKHAYKRLIHINLVALKLFCRSWYCLDRIV